MKEDYIQHNPGVPTGAAPILSFLPVLKDAGLTVKTHRVLSEGDLVAVHSTYDNAQAFGGQTMVAFDVFRSRTTKSPSSGTICRPRSLHRRQPMAIR
ncbi:MULTISPECIES: hypothetical protein [unclassified Mesorhizobium]|uniref:nuclear transport factor 2 family protein n=1 Tax=unclassified Mesorhizobium TaxID=325217 RepID=UPI001AECED54|nr:MULTISPECIES: hypothetical protein [unclassified Mesorhizobium]